MKRLIKQKLQIIILSCLLCVTSLWAQEVKRIVSVDRAVIYAEPSEKSYRIDTVRRGTVLILFEKGIEESEWLYVTFQSQRWKNKVTGFIKAELVVTEEEMLKEDQRRMEEEAQEQKASEVMEQPEEKEEVKTEAETKPQGELPDLKAAFAKKKPAAPVTPEVKEEEKKEEVKETEAAPEKVEEKKEPVRTVVTEGVTESPQNTEVLMPVEGEKAESEPYAIKKEEIPTPPPSALKPEEKIEEEAKAKLETEALAEKKETVPPEPEEKEILEEIPQAKEITAPQAKIVEAEEFKRPEPPPPVITVMDGITASPQGRNINLLSLAQALKSQVYCYIEIEAPKVIQPEEEEKEKEKEEEPKVTKPPAQTVKPADQVVPSQKLAKPKVPKEVGFLSLGLGYGPSWGGLGGAVQLNITSDVSVHIGAGMYPTKTYYSEFDWVRNETLYSIGVKYYLPFGNEKFRSYADLMYGGVSVEAVQLVKEIWYYQYSFENIQKTLYGPSLMAGVELKLGFITANALLGISYNTTAWDYWDRDYFLNFGLGFLYYF